MEDVSSVAVGDGSMKASQMCDARKTDTTDRRGDGHIVGIERDAAGRLIVRLAGRDEPITDAKAVRCFPWSMPDSYVSIHSPEGKEAAMIKSLDELNDVSRAVLEEELKDKVFNPKILEIVDYKDEFGVTSITAETDRGRVTFQLRSRDDVRVLTGTRALFRDVDGNTYELPDLAALDPTSRKQLERYF